MPDGAEANLKKYTEQLAQDPKSRAFVPLADLYRQLGRYDEAIAVATDGLKQYPHYVAGKMALARAHYENGDADQAQELLENVLATAPDNLLANRILAEICAQKGDKDRARVAIRRILSVDAADKHSNDLLKSLETSPKAAAKAAPAPIPSAPTPPTPQALTPQEVVVAVPESDPVGTAMGEGVRTVTVAELYLRQGHTTEALEVYRELAIREPGNDAYTDKVRQLEGRVVRRPAAPDPLAGKRRVLETLLARIGERRRNA
ncbi:MAG: tetratricopeptide repeat protein [Pseudomonadota bacterium]